MSVYHCPLCPLVFHDRGEVERHVGEEHRSRSHEEGDLRLELAATSDLLDWGRLETLRSQSGGPAVSLLLATTPAPSMSVLDIARLRQLADRARRRLPAEPTHAAVASVLAHRVSAAVAAAEGSVTDHGLAVLVSLHQVAVLTLPIEPRDRAVVDGLFATRDLEYALRRYPPYRVLVLGRPTRILEGRGGQLSEVDTARLQTAGPSVAFGRRDRDARRIDGLLDRQADADGDRPLIVIGNRRRLLEFRRHASHANAVMAEARRPRIRMTAIADIAQQALDAWHRNQQNRAIAELDRAALDDQIKWGLTTAWEAVTSKATDHLWVEQDFACPGRIIPGRHGIQITTDPAEPGVIDDLVDALLTRASHHGIRVDLLEKGTLGRAEPIAARTTANRREPPGRPLLPAVHDRPAPPDDTLRVDCRAGTPS
jgi:hypothetical protein